MASSRRRQFYVTTLPTDSRRLIFTDAGGSDEYGLLRDVFTTGGIRGGVQVFEYSGTNEIIVDNYFGAAAQRFTSPTALSAQPRRRQPVRPRWISTYYGDFELSFRLSNNGADTVYASPDPTTTLILDGSNPNGVLGRFVRGSI